MKVDDAKAPDLPRRRFGGSDEDLDTWLSPELIRLIVAPLVTTILFVGGVYWIRAQVAGAPANHAQETTAFVQVRLLPRPDPIPVPMPSAPQPSAKAGTLNSAQSNAGRAAHEASAQAEPATDDEIASAEPDESLAAPGISPSVPQTAAQNAAITKFTGALLRHIAAYQHYPKAAEPQRLQGTVQTVFSISRSGRLLGVWVKGSSGEAVLDQAAIDTIRRAQPLPAIPSELPDPLRVEVKLGFDP